MAAGHDSRKKLMNGLENMVKAHKAMTAIHEIAENITSSILTIKKFNQQVQQMKLTADDDSAEVEQQLRDAKIRIPELVEECMQGLKHAEDLGVEVSDKCRVIKEDQEKCEKLENEVINNSKPVQVCEVEEIIKELNNGINHCVEFASAYGIYREHIDKMAKSNEKLSVEMHKGSELLQKKAGSIIPTAYVKVGLLGLGAVLVAGAATALAVFLRIDIPIDKLAPLMVEKSEVGLKQVKELLEDAKAARKKLMIISDRLDGWADQLETISAQLNKMLDGFNAVESVPDELLSESFKKTIKMMQFVKNKELETEKRVMQAKQDRDQAIKAAEEIKEKQAEENKRLQEQLIAAQQQAEENKRLKEQLIAAQQQAEENKRPQQLLIAAQQQAEENKILKEEQLIAAQQQAEEMKRLKEQMIAAQQQAEENKILKEQLIAAQQQAEENKRLQEQPVAAQQQPEEMKKPEQLIKAQQQAEENKRLKEQLIAAQQQAEENKRP